MKRTIAILFVLMVVYFYAIAQDATKVSTKDSTVIEKLVLSPKDSIYLEYMDFIANMTAYNLPRFKLYPTENMYNLIKLDTATGALWQVQYGMNKSANRMEVPIDDTSLLWDNTHLRAGRFELYPTQNMFTFILLDTENGNTYQVQWNTNAQQRFRIRIY